MKKALFVGVGVLTILTCSNVAIAIPVSWEPIVGDATVEDSTLIFNSDNSWYQAQGVHGSGFMATGPKINFDVDWWSYDSYSTGYGWYDVFGVNINQDGYIFDNPWHDPVTSSSYTGGTVTDSPSFAGNSFLWGGQKWDRNKETLSGNFSLSLNEYDPTKQVYVSVFMKSDVDSLFGSGGTVTIDNAAPVPEPATVMLFGVGLAGIVGASARRKKKVKT